jgi:hypothetical protein
MSKKTTVNYEMSKDYRYYGDEMELLGQRLDAARQSLSLSRKPWAQKYWSEVLDRLTFQWQSLPVLHDGQAKNNMVSRWTVDYNFFERDDGAGQLDLGNRVLKNMLARPDFEYTWHRHLERRLMRAPR